MKLNCIPIYEWSEELNVYSEYQNTWCKDITFAQQIGPRFLTSNIQWLHSTEYLYK